MVEGGAKDLNSETRQVTGKEHHNDPPEKDGDALGLAVLLGQETLPSNYNTNDNIIDQWNQDETTDEDVGSQLAKESSFRGSEIMIKKRPRHLEDRPQTQQDCQHIDETNLHNSSCQWRRLGPLAAGCFFEEGIDFLGYHNIQIEITKEIKKDHKFVHGPPGTRRITIHR